ncbi:Bifunctional protein GlmU [Nitrospira sp. KM1]|uniref:bifunctional UDP-N-acetylglucosamine diphosphorylase/glucosamine-1-phosphate N-acetyltransferase GlmU n=1 Tax=Nitrospira sp. KM1 TaxID=1936990 RepID=UPI0013A70F83|nr:bifunctional UDP-N-acetylglucosamine diphosphorylase/glucosamine-1-phosphate N-acetyltransferase GlmU [Nitrospira sp. KM1]BCA54166.1 Bifunctional protein GlmU [Nitrospira sp. KM1]
MNRSSVDATTQPVSVGASPTTVPGLAVVIMAAGMGKRMRSKQSKVLHPVAGRSMVLYSIDLGLRLAGHRIGVVVGHQADQVRQVIEAATSGLQGTAPTSIVEQREQLGTGHAVMQARSVFSAKGPAPSLYLILNGDTPLLREFTVRELLRVHREERATVTILTSVLSDATGYGRVLRQSPGGSVSRIVEDRDASPEEKKVGEINVGTYVVDGDFLFSALEKLDPSNAQGEYYLTDIIQVAVSQGRRVSAVVLDNPDEGLGVNTRRQLAEAEQVIRRQIREHWLDQGVTMIDPSSVWIDAGAMIGRDTILHPNVMLAGDTVIGEDCIVHSFTRVTDCTVGNGVEILGHCVFREARIDDHAVLGPFAHLRPGAVVRKKAKVGNFVEMKQAELGEGSKANHLTYLGDARIGKGVNIGAGTITVNYDGVRKHQTVIEDNVAVGSDTQLIAPVKVGAGAIIAAGTTVTEDVPAGALVIARVPQVNREGWAARRRAMLTSPHNAGSKSPAKTSKPQVPTSRAKRRR